MRGQGELDAVGVGQKWMRINQVVRENRLGILVLQETHLTSEGAAAVNRVFESSLKILVSADERNPSGARGVAFVVSKQMMEANRATLNDIVPGRAAQLVVPWGKNEELKVLGIYAPNIPSENENFWKCIENKIKCGGIEKPDVMAGDFNMVLDAMDRRPARNDAWGQTKALADLVATMDMSDGWRNENPNKHEYSFLQASTGSQSRIDRIYVAKPMQHMAADWEIRGSGVQTDHRMVMCSLANYATPYIGEGRWALGGALLKDQIFLTEVKRTGEELLTNIERETHNWEVQTKYETWKQNVCAAARRRTKALYAKLDIKRATLAKQLEEVNN
ncbi:Endonuclease/exonuclease/phosphatase, partial [Lenzites betulinus]